MENINSPRWVDNKKIAIIVSATLDGEAIQYVAAPDDCVEAGRAIHARCLAGEFGEIGEPELPKTEQEQWAERYELDSAECKEALCAEADIVFKSDKLLAGFTFNGKRIQTDEPARNNAAGYLNTLVAGITEILPIVWRTEENEFLSFASLEEYKPFATAFVTFVKDAYASIFMVKDAIRAAPSFGDAWSKYSAYKYVK